MKDGFDADVLEEQRNAGEAVRRALIVAATFGKFRSMPVAASAPQPRRSPYADGKSSASSRPDAVYSLL
jgi:hypothetical protein